MLIITAGTADYAPMIRASVENGRRFGYRFLVYDLGSLGFGEPFAVDPSDFVGHAPPATFKPALIVKAAERIQPGRLFAWLDGDAVLVRPLDELRAIPFDVAVTLREREHIGAARPWTSYLNSGVMFFRKTAAGLDFLRRWAEAVRAIPNDQGALNELVGPGWTNRQWRQAYGRSLGCAGGARVHILPARHWNYWHFPAAPGPDVKILHFKRRIRAAFNLELCRA